MSDEQVYVCLNCEDTFTCCDECAQDAADGNPPRFCCTECAVADVS